MAGLPQIESKSAGEALSFPAGEPAARDDNALHPYHIKFLHHLLKHDVVFLVIGGQARRLIHAKHSTRDLDIWVRLKAEDKPLLEQAIICWAKQHRQHSNQNLVRPLPLRPGVQIVFPENDCVVFKALDGSVGTVSVGDRVDILTSLEGMDFEACRLRANIHDIEGARVSALCAADLDEADKLRAQADS
jgi:hypothetical protein